MDIKKKNWLIKGLVAIVLVIAIIIILNNYDFKKNDLNIYGGNGRIEAVEIDIAPRIAGRIKELLVREGDFVKSNQTVAFMDTEELQAELKEAKAKLLEAKSNVSISKSILIQKQSEKISAEALVEQRKTELELAKKRLFRSSTLVREGAISQQETDDDYAKVHSTADALKAAIAGVNAAEAVIVTAREQISGAEFAVEAAKATIERVQANINDSDLVSPRDGRIQYLIAQVGEVIPSGGKILNLVDLSDVYMTFFMPTTLVGKVFIGAEVKIVLDAAADYAIPAKVSFISDVAQFTPKTVETKLEREKLMFRVRAQLPSDLLKKYITQVKTGLPGMAYIRLDPSKPWPDFLEKLNEL
jgi:HlyD family secretion protein